MDIIATTRGPVGIARKHAEPDGSAPVLHDERDVRHLQSSDRAVQPVDVSIERVVRRVGEIVGAAVADVLWRDDSKSRGEQHADDVGHLPAESRAPSSTMARSLFRSNFPLGSVGIWSLLATIQRVGTL